MNTEHKSAIEQQVMGSVAVIYVARTLVSPAALVCYAGASCIAIASFISVPHVVQNFEASAQGGMPHIIGFTIAAIVGTQLVVQLGLLVATLASTSLLVRVARSFRGTRSFA